MRSDSWYHVSSHGAILFYIAMHPGCSVREISEDMCLTPRTVWGLIGDLKRAGMLRVERRGKRHHYHVDLDGPLLVYPSVQGLRLRSILGRVVAEAAPEMFWTVRRLLSSGLTNDNEGQARREPGQP
jgi:DNA-binding IclR family transcriptional regulator